MYVRREIKLTLTTRNREICNIGKLQSKTTVCLRKTCKPTFLDSQERHSERPWCSFAQFFVQFSCTKWTYNCLALPGNTVLSVWQAFPDSASSNLCLRKHFDVYELMWSRSDLCKRWRSISNTDLKLDNIQREHLSFVWKKKTDKIAFYDTCCEYWQQKT